MNKTILKLLLKRIASSLLLIFLIITILFFLLRISPGSPVQKFISEDFSIELSQKIKSNFQLDKTLFEQYGSFIAQAVKLDFGTSYNYNLPVFSVIKDYLIFTVIFSFISLIVQIKAGSLFAFISVYKKNKYLNGVLDSVAIFSFALPSFLLGLLLIYIFSIILGILPSNGLTSINHDDLSVLGKFWDYVIHLILPVLSLSLTGTFIFYKYIKESVSEVSRKNFILNLQAIGEKKSKIILYHVLPNSINPILTIAGLELGALLSGSLITEVLFGLPGMGRLTITAILTRDYPLVIGCTFISGLLIIFANLLADFLKTVFDKRIINTLNN
ncbi:MAG TPA: ABC transporter permease [Ignavibacteriaceae bacterium]|nr:ABC transporter permease [Ignavibacteriaceae bacterium]